MQYPVANASMQLFPSYHLPTQECDAKCHSVETVTDTCGFHKKVCQCKNPPQCQPKKPEDIACHEITKVPLGYHGCDGETDKCVECFQWKYDLIPPKNNIKKVSGNKEAEAVT